MFGPAYRNIFRGVAAVLTWFLASAFAEKESSLPENMGLEPSAASAPRTSPVRVGVELANVGPYVWRGIRVTQGNCIQPLVWASYGKFKAGVFVNMYGSKKDLLYQEVRNADKTLTPEKGSGSKGPGEISEVKLHLDWEHAFTEMLQVNVGYTHLAYSTFPVNYANKDEFGEYRWFSKKASYGELNLVPRLRFGDLSLFTEQNLVIQAGTWIKTKEEWDDAAGVFYNDTSEITDRWNYQFSLGAAFGKRTSERSSIAMELRENFASKGFLSKWVRELGSGEPVDTQGFYSTTLQLSTRYEPVKWFFLSPNVGAEIITNDIISNNSNIRGALLFGGVTTAFSW